MYMYMYIYVCVCVDMLCIIIQHKIDDIPIKICHVGASDDLDHYMMTRH